jgi:hypothetical protein
MTSSLTGICASAGDGVAAFTTTYWSVLLPAEGDAPCSFNDRANNDITKKIGFRNMKLSRGRLAGKTELAVTH